MSGCTFRRLFDSRQLTLNRHRVYLIDEPYGPIKIYQDARNNSQFTGVVCLKKTSDLEKTSLNTKIVELFVAGDTAVNLFTVLNSKSMERPMVHDMMANILSQVQMEDPRHW